MQLIHSLEAGQYFRFTTIAKGSYVAVLEFSAPRDGFQVGRGAGRHSGLRAESQKRDYGTSPPGAERGRPRLTGLDRPLTFYILKPNP